MAWFGPRGWGAPICEPEQRIAIPVGEPCSFCDEPIAEGDEGVSWPHLGADDDDWKLRPQHIACAQRSVVGGANHILGRCTCCGGTEPPDPPHLSRREAALLAVRLSGG